MDNWNLIKANKPKPPEGPKLVKVFYEDANGRIVTKLEPDKYQSFEEQLEAEGAKFSSRFGDVIYPKSILAAYDRVMTGRWNVFEHGNPEAAIDFMIKKHIDSITNKTEYMGMLKTALMDDKIKTCLVLRLTYAALMEESVDQIIVHRTRKAALTCENTDEMIVSEEDGLIYVGDSPIDMDNEVIDKKAEEFYAEKEVVSETIHGLPLSKREKLAQKVVDLGYEFIQDREAVYSELKLYATDYETSLVARLAFLLLTKDDNINPKLLA